MQETWVWSLSQEDPLEEEMATHSSIFAWRIPWTEEPGGLQSLGLQRVGHNLVTKQQQYSLIYTLWWRSTNSRGQISMRWYLGSCISQLGLTWQNTTDCGAYALEIYFHTVLETGTPRIRCSQEQCLVQIAPFFLVSSLRMYSERKRGTSACLFLFLWRHQPYQIGAPLLPHESVLSRFSRVRLFATYIL